MRTVAIAALAGTSVGAHAQSFSHPNNDLCERSFISDAVSGQFFGRRQAEDFRLGSSTSVQSVRWWGGASPFGGVSDLSNVEAFRIVIFDDSAGLPSSVATPVYDQSFPAAQTAPRATGFDTFGDNSPSFENTVQLPSALQLQGGRDYWITIGADLIDPNGAAWRWASSLEGNFVTAQQQPFGADWALFDPSGSNYAFEFNPLPDGAVCLPEGGCIGGTEQTAFTTGGMFMAGSDCGTPDCQPFAVFTQAPTQPCNPSFNSDAVPGQFAGALSADNFELPTDATVDGVRWWGGSQFFQDFDLFNFASWTITIYGSNTDGTPDQSSVVVQETFFQSETDPVLSPYRNRQDADLYEQMIQFSAPVALEGGERYWIAIGTTNFDPNSDGWRWSGSLGGDFVAATLDWASGAFSVFDPSTIDYAFQLLGTADDVGCPADLAAPFGVLNIFDIQAFIGLYNAQDAGADLAAPFGTFNIFDIQAYINLYNQGCP